MSLTKHFEITDHLLITRLLSVTSRIHQKNQFIIFTNVSSP